MQSRRRAAGLVALWLRSGGFPERALASDEANRAFLMEVTYGVVRRYRSLEWVREQLAPRKPSPALHALLLVGLYQLLFMDHVATYAALNETVEAAKLLGDAAAPGFLNAVLRRASAEKEELLRALAMQAMGIRHSHPDLLVQRWERAFGAERTRSLLKWNNSPPRVTLTLCRSRTDARALCERFLAEGVEAEPHPFAPERSVLLPRGSSVMDLPGYRDGLFFVQDPAGLAAVDLLAPVPGESILDACAAPGGKTMLIADALRGRGRLVAADSRAKRLARLRENVARMRWDFIEIAERDAGRAQDAPATFDAVLLDVPCTNTGVLGRRPEARWRFSLENLRTLTVTQRAMLCASAPALRPGGRLVYSTCSLEPEEGKELVAAWLAQRDDLKLMEERTLFPPDSGTDGAYAALLIKA